VFGGLAGNYEAGVSRTVMGFGYVRPTTWRRMRSWNEYNTGDIWGPYHLEAPDDAAIVGVGCGACAAAVRQARRQELPPAPARRSTSPRRARPALPGDIAALAESEGTAAAPGWPLRPSTGVPIELLATQPRGSPNVASLKVLAAEDQGFKEFDEVTVKLQLAQAQKLVYGRGEPRATSIMIQLEHTAAIPQVSARIRTLLDQVMPGHALTVMDFRELNPFYGETIALFNTIFGFIFVLIGGIVLFTVSNTMMAAVMERTTEIGTVRAVGLRQSGIRKLFVTEGFLLGCVGAVVGVVRPCCWPRWSTASSLTWLPPGSSTPLPLTIRVLGQYGMIIGTTIGLIVIATGRPGCPLGGLPDLSIVDALEARLMNRARLFALLVPAVAAWLTLAPLAAVRCAPMRRPCWWPATRSATPASPSR
jgi:putative ABC transport system permease protein